MTNSETTKENKAGKKIVISANKDVNSMYENFTNLIHNMAIDNAKFADFFKKTTGLTLSKRNVNNELIANDVLALALTFAIKELENINKSAETSKIIAVTRKNPTTETKNPKTKIDVQIRLGKFLESLIIHNRNLHKTHGNGALGSVFINSTVIRREGNFNPDFVNRFLVGEFNVTIQNKSMSFLDIQNELATFGIDTNFNNFLRNEPKENEKPNYNKPFEKILEIVEKNYPI
jgi:hypothetical protein